MQYCIVGGLLVVVFCFSIAKPFITLLADDRFYEAWTVFGLAAATVFITSIFSMLLPPIYMAKRVALIMLSQAVGALMTLLSFYILLDHGIYGAALSTLIGAIAMVLCQILINRKLSSVPEMPIHYLKVFNRGIIFSVACIVSYNFDTNNYPIFIVKVFLLFSILIYFNREDLKEIFGEILKSTYLVKYFDGSKNVSDDAKKIIILYDQYSTHTNTVFEHLSAYANFSKHKFAYFHGESRTTKIKWDQFDALIIHYSLRVAFDAIQDRLSDQIEKFDGLKILFVQDEYDLTENTRKAIKKLGIDIVYTCVPAQHIELIYPSEILQKVKFITNLTGYAPLIQNGRTEIVPIKNRKITVGYRGRALPYWYGDLGQEKEIIARSVKNYCEQKNIISDIEWDDSKRIYGDEWPKFQASIKCTLGTESGSNLFDYDGSIRTKFQQFLAANPGSCYSDARYAVLRNNKEVEIMNQISPRIFEAISCGTALVLFEGSYSGILQPGRHYLSLKKDFSNIDEVFSIISDDEKLQEMVDRAFDEILVGNQYSYKSFIFKFDQMLSKECENKIPGIRSEIEFNRITKKYPARRKFVPAPFIVRFIWMRIPLNMRKSIKPFIRELFNL
jgi:hypothetical protein